MMAKTGEQTGTRSTTSLVEGWKQAPGWFKVAVYCWTAIHALGLVMLLTGLSPFGIGLQPPASAADVLIRLALAGLSLMALAALVGTVTDIFAAEPDVRQQKLRSLAIGLALVALCVMFFAATLVRMGSNVLNRPL